MTWQILNFTVCRVARQHRWYCDHRLQSRHPVHTGLYGWTAVSLGNQYINYVRSCPLPNNDAWGVMSGNMERRGVRQRQCAFHLVGNCLGAQLTANTDLRHELNARLAFLCTSWIGYPLNVWPSGTARWTACWNSSFPAVTPARSIHTQRTASHRANLNVCSTVNPQIKAGSPI